MMRKRVYIAYTGGTIGMLPTEEGYKPAPGALKQQMEKIPELGDSSMPIYDISEYNPLIDSSNMTPDIWNTIACDIEEKYHDYDGFVILHGTDTMAYTASALAFMLEGLDKSVILTGSQIPLSEIRNDARVNLITSLMIAANYRIPEVCLYFGDKLLRGCRAVKVSANQLDAFDSPNYPSLGIAGVNIKLNEKLILKNRGTPFKVHSIENHSVGTLRIFPGMSAEVVHNILRQPLKGLVLETYGVGNVPDQDKELLGLIRGAVTRGVVIVACTQCLYGSVRLGEYAPGSALEKAGVISGYDITMEAALTKLLFLFSRGLTSQEVKAYMLKNLRGEITK
jgi:L-asparaginase